MTRPAGSPLPRSLPLGLQRAFNDRPTDQDTWRVAIDWCLARQDPHQQPLRDALEWADRLQHDAFGLRVGFEHHGAVQWMRWVPAGVAILGANPGEPGYHVREGLREVTISRPYWLGESVVDQALYRAVTGRSPARRPGPTCPVERVSHPDAARFMEHLNMQYPGLRMRFPTESEWEIGCRAGTREATWAGELLVVSEYEAVPLDDMAWYGGTSGFEGPRASEDGTPNPLGLRDMLGNVWEWCADTYSPTPPSGTDPLTVSDWGHVTRGGSWRGFALDLRAARRGQAGASFDRTDDVGFRLAQTARVV